MGTGLGCSGYETTGNWYKGNAHLHTTASDGGATAAEAARLYAEAGYDFLFRTDHWAASDMAGEAEEAPLLWLDGVELDGPDDHGTYYHVACLGKVAGIERGMGLTAAMGAAREQGALTVLAHPHWSGNGPADALRHDFDGVEIYNHVCRWLNGKGDGLVHWEAMLRSGRNALAFAVDDAHLRPEHPGYNGGWIVVNAREREADALLAALRAGRFYSSCGPDFHAIRRDGGRVSVETSSVAFIRLVGPGSEGARIGSFEGELFTEASFDLPPEWAYAYVEIEDAHRRRAWTNNLLATP